MLFIFQFLPTTLTLDPGSTRPPPLLSESDLLSCMDKVPTFATYLFKVTKIYILHHDFNTGSILFPYICWLCLSLGWYWYWCYNAWSYKKVAWPEICNQRSKHSLFSDKPCNLSLKLIHFFRFILKYKNYHLQENRSIVVKSWKLFYWCNLFEIKFS